ncbi:hypothetical protein C980_00351 [Brucella abortus 88/217]|nr:hypothetical protein C980_00351 [Brucella abortus 88/217]
MVKEPRFSSRLEKPLTTAQYVADYLRKRMLSGEIRAGDRLKQNHLAEMLGLVRRRFVRPCAILRQKGWFGSMRVPAVLPAG